MTVHQHLSSKKRISKKKIKKTHKQTKEFIKVGVVLNLF